MPFLAEKFGWIEFDSNSVARKIRAMNELDLKKAFFLQQAFSARLLQDENLSYEISNRVRLEAACSKESFYHRLITRQNPPLCMQ